MFRHHTNLKNKHIKLDNYGKAIYLQLEKQFIGK